MRTNSSRADVQQNSHLFVGVACGEQANNLPLTKRESGLPAAHIDRMESEVMHRSALLGTAKTRAPLSWLRAVVSESERTRELEASSTRGGRLSLTRCIQ